MEMMRTLPVDILWLGFIACLSYGIGNALFSLGPVFSVCLGLAVLSALSYALARYGLVYSMIYYILFLILMALTWKRIFSFFKTCVSPQDITRLEKALFAVFAAAALLILAGNYAPPTEGRGLIADLRVPKMIAESHGWAGFAGPVQMLYAMALCVRGVLFAKLLHGFLWILTALLLYHGLGYWRSRFGMKQGVYTAVLTGIVAGFFILSLRPAAENLPLLAGRVSREDFLRSRLRFYDLIEFANENLSRSARVVLAGTLDPDSYYWNAETEAPGPGLLEEIDLGALIRRLRAQRITHVLVFKDLSGAELGWNIPRLEATHFTKDYEDPKVILYRVDYLDNSNKV